MEIFEFLGTLGWHKEGTIKRGRHVVGYVYTCDRVTDDDLARVREYWPDAERWRSRSQYAPEQRHPCVFVPSKAERGRKTQAERKAQADRQRKEQAYARYQPSLF